jgi:hypothetical protein
MKNDQLWKSKRGRITLEKDIVERTYHFALRVIKLVGSLPRNKVYVVIGSQLLSNYSA